MFTYDRDSSQYCIDSLPKKVSWPKAGINELIFQIGEHHPSLDNVAQGLYHIDEIWSLEILNNVATYGLRITSASPPGCSCPCKRCLLPVLELRQLAVGDVEVIIVFDSVTVFLNRRHHGTNIVLLFILCK